MHAIRHEMYEVLPLVLGEIPQVLEQKCIHHGELFTSYSIVVAYHLRSMNVEWNLKILINARKTHESNQFCN